jgi:hypothetical protein
MAVGPFNNVERPLPSAFSIEGQMDEYPGATPGEDVTVDMQGEDSPDMEGDDFEIIEDEEGGATIIFDQGESMLTAIGFGENIAEVLDENELGSISNDLLTLITEDVSSRAEWEKTYEEGLTLLGLTYDERTEPFDGATGVTHPILNEAVTQFQAQAYKELLPPGGPTRTQILGKVTPEKEAQADRVRQYMNYQLTEVMEEYDPDFDQMLYYVGYGGSAFKKVYYDGDMGRAASPFVKAKDIIVPYSAKDLLTAERVTHVVRISSNNLKKQQVSGFYRDVELQEPTERGDDIIEDKVDKITGIEPGASPDEYTLYECHCYLDIPGYEDVDAEGEPTGIKLPYIVTIDSDSGKILSIRQNYREDDPRKRKRQYFVHYKFLPGLGFYGFGLVHLIGNLSRSSTSLLRQLIDAGTLSNLPAGFKAKGMRIQDQESPLQPGEWRDVDAPGGALRENLMPLPYKEPSATLFQLMGFCITAAQKFIGTTDLGMGDSNQELPVGTTIALLERGSRVMSAVHKRLHYAQKQELRLLAQVFAEHLPDQYPYEVAGADQNIKAQDFSGKIDIVPVSDPNIFSMTQRITLAQEQLKLAQVAPDMHNLYEAYRRMYSALGVQDIQAILPPPVEPKPEGAAVENARSLTMPQGEKALRVFPDQDHMAHIQAHMQFILTPIVQTSPPVYGILIGHVMEHIAMLSAKQVEQHAMMLQQQGQQVPLEMLSAEAARLEAQLVTQVLQQLNPQAQGGDPLVELKNRELDLREQDNMRKAQMDAAQVRLEQQRNAERMRMDAARITSNEQIAQLRVAAQLQNRGGM